MSGTVGPGEGVKDRRRGDGMAAEEVQRIQMAYAERERTLPGTLKRDKANAGNRWLEREHRRRLEQILRQSVDRPPSEWRILDVGCGYGSLLGWFNSLGVPDENLFGIDLLANRIERARETYPRFTLLQGNAEQLDFPNGSFDLVPVFTVFTSILEPGLAERVAASIGRVLKTDGVVVWYDMRYPNPWNSHLRAMTKQRIRELFPSFSLELETISVIPPLARRLGATTDWSYPLLGSIPVLRSHYIGLLRRERATTNPTASEGRRERPIVSNRPSQSP
jgi:SAM-dependent methyltransferase